MKMKNDIVVEQETKTEEPIVKEEPKVEKKKTNGAILHTIKEGDTLDKIQDEYGVTYDDIKGLNRISKLTNLKTGEKIRVK